MHIRFTTLLIVLSMLLGASISYAPVYKIEEWVKESADAENKNYLYCFAVKHPLNNGQHVSDRHQKDIAAAAQKLNAHVIAEDMLDYTGPLQSYTQACLDITKKRKASNHYDGSVGPIFGLTQACRAQGVRCLNVEFRYHVTPHVLDEQVHEKKPTCAEVASELFEVYQEIVANSRDDAQLKLMYDEMLDHADTKAVSEALDALMRSIEEYDQKKFYNTIVARIEAEKKVTADTKKQSNGARKDSVEYVFDAWLNARILHAIAHSDAKTMFVCAGGLHIDCIRQWLYQLGYKPTHPLEEILKFPRDNEYIDNPIDIADYFNEQPAPAIQPRRFPFFTIFCAAATLATITYLGYWWYQNSALLRTRVRSYLPMPITP